MSKNKIKKIGIDARFFGPKDKGFGRYTENLVRNLEKIDNINQYFIFLRKDSWQDYQPESHNFKKILTDYRWYGWKEQILLPLKLKKYKLDLVHFTHFNVPIFYRGKFIVTIHDLTLRTFPTFKKNLRNFLFYPLKRLMYRLVFAHAVKEAEKIIAISNYTKNEILKYYKVNPEKVEVIYEGAPEISKFPVKRDPATRGKIQKPYLLYVGNAYPHKNLERLILAFKKLVEEYNLDYQLVLVGGDDYFYNFFKKHLKQVTPQLWGNDQPSEAPLSKAKRSFINQRVVFTGFVNDGEIDNLYRNASLYIFPSLCEGFGLPPLEAMAHGLPVVSSNATCLPEILGDAALYFNPLDINDIAEKIKKALLDNNLREELIKKGLEQIKNYSWQKMAEETLDLYET